MRLIMGADSRTDHPREETMDVIEHLLGQRACRAYAADPVPDGDLATILRAATHAPSAENRQPWVFVVVRDAATRAAVDGVARRVWDAGGRRHAQDGLAPHFFAAVDGFVAAGHGGAPVVVVVAGDGRDGLPPAVLASSVFPAVQNLLLAAGALGYGSAMTTLAVQDPGTLATAVGLPEKVRPLAVVPVGRPAAPLGPPRRRPLVEVAHLDRFGTPFSVAGGPPRPARPPA
jgi:nitroreductase